MYSVPTIGGVDRKVVNLRAKKPEQHSNLSNFKTMMKHVLKLRRVSHFDVGEFQPDAFHHLVVVLVLHDLDPVALHGLALSNFAELRILK